MNTRHFNVPKVFEGLIDYAGLFPPAGLGMREAVTEYSAHQQERGADMMARFIIPSSRLTELHAYAGLFDDRSPLRLSILAAIGGSLPFLVQRATELGDEFSDSFQGTTRVEMIEARCPTPLLDASEAEFAEVLMIAASGRARLYVELPVAQDSDASIAQLGAFAAVRSQGRPDLAAKIRFGGASPSDYPGTVDAARFIHACIHLGIPFKATAGLHHPVRHFNKEAGATMHGFMNLLMATSFGVVYGWNVAELETVLSETDPGAFSLTSAGLGWRDHLVPESALASVRNAVFKGFGSCSLREPISDLDDLDWFGSPQR